MRRTRSRGRAAQRAGRVADDPVARVAESAATREGSTSARGSRRPARRPSAPVTETTAESEPVLPAWPALGSGEVRTDVPNLDDVLAGSQATGSAPWAAVPAPDTGPQDAVAPVPFPAPSAPTPDVAAPSAPTPEAPGRASSRGAAARTARLGDLRKAGTRGRSAVGRAAGPLRRRVPAGVLTRRSTVVVTAVVALGLGVGCGLGIEAVGSAGGADPDQPPPATAQECAVAQVAWSRAAAAQASMSQDKPKTLRDGFLRAQAVVDGVTPPSAVAADWSTYARYVDTVAGAVSEVKKDAQITDAVATALAGVDTAEVMAASDRITAYLRAGCEATS